MKKLLLAALIASLASSLSGCFPVVATGVGTGVLMAEDRRTSGAIVEDQGIEIKSSNRIGEQLKDQVHINITSFNRNVLMTGEASTEALRSQAESIVQGVPNVNRVIDEVAIGSPSSFSSRSNDTYLTTKVKARMIDAQKFQVNHVKVVTEAGTVFLMGLVTHKEADDAVEITRTTSGVLRVVKVFEYLD
jgi:osmotically-inducible protein OsmY